MKPIWYFVGLILLVIGSLIFLAGIYYLIEPSSRQTVLAETHPNLWWGAIMMIFGAILYFKTRKEVVE
jgi:divalent metal cation (Fe/Co/Zn/Cd) transporter